MKIPTLIGKLQVVRAVLVVIKDYLLSFMMKAELNREEFGYYRLVPINLKLPIVSFIVDRVLGYSYKEHKYWLGDGCHFILFPPSQWDKGAKLYSDLQHSHAVKRMWYHRRKLLR